MIFLFLCMKEHLHTCVRLHVVKDALSSRNYLLIRRHVATAITGTDENHFNSSGFIDIS